MKIQNKLTLATLFLMLLFSCRTDEFTVEKGDLTMMTEAHLSGVIVNRDNQPISNAVVSLSGRMTETDENGVFSFRKIDLSSDGSIIKIEKPGYFDGFFFAYGVTDEQSFLEGVLVEREEQQFLSSIGATIPINGGANIIFDPNSIVTGGGQLYEGVVKVSAHWYDPSSEETAFSMPGDLRGSDQNTNPVQLVTYGMMAVELSSPSGVELQLAPESKATLKFPITGDSDVLGFDLIPMWYLDEESGIWIEEGSVVIEGNFLVGEVSHFSFWNCDVPYPLVNITGSLIAEDGTPLSYQIILIKDNNNNISQYGSTNESGVFSGKVPADVELSIFHHVCDGAVSIAELGVLSEDTNLGPITAETVNSTTLLVTLEDCEMQSITQGYVKMSSPTTAKTVTTDQGGRLEYPFFHCNETDMTLVAYDFTSPMNSEALVIETSETVLDLGTVYLCDSIPGEYVRYLINGKAHASPLDQFEVFIVDDRILYIYAHLEYDSIGISASPSLQFKYDIIDEVAQYYPRGFTANGEYLTTSGNNLEVQVSEIGDVGSFVSLTFDNGVFEGEMKVFIDEYIESGLVRGKVWRDENENGLQDSNEQGLAGRRIDMRYLSHSFLAVAGYSLYPQPINQSNFVYSDNDGNFEFNGVFVQKLSRLTFSGQGEDEVTIDNAGNDNIDSDFYNRFNALHQYDTDDFILEPGGEKIDFGLGIKQ